MSSSGNDEDRAVDIRTTSSSSTRSSAHAHTSARQSQVSIRSDALTISHSRHHAEDDDDDDEDSIVAPPSRGEPQLIVPDVSAALEEIKEAPWRRPFGAALPDLDGAKGVQSTLSSDANPRRNTDTYATDIKPIQQEEEVDEDEEGDEHEPRPSRSAPQPTSFVESSFATQNNSRLVMTSTTEAAAPAGARPWERYLASHQQERVSGATVTPTRPTIACSSPLSHSPRWLSSYRHGAGNGDRDDEDVETSTNVSRDGSRFNVIITPPAQRRPSHPAPLASPNPRSEYSRFNVTQGHLTRGGPQHWSATAEATTATSSSPTKTAVVLHRASGVVSSSPPPPPSRFAPRLRYGRNASHTSPSPVRENRRTHTDEQTRDRRASPLGRASPIAALFAPVATRREEPAMEETRRRDSVNGIHHGDDGGVHSHIVETHTPIRLWDRADVRAAPVPVARAEAHVLPLPSPHALSSLTRRRASRDAANGQRRLHHHVVDFDAPEDDAAATAAAGESPNKSKRVAVPPAIFTAPGTENRAVSAEAVDWLGLQQHLRHRSHATLIHTLDLSCNACLTDDQWRWFSESVLPQLDALEVLLLRGMALTDTHLSVLSRGCQADVAVAGIRTAPRTSIHADAAALPAAYYHRRASAGPQPTTSSKQPDATTPSSRENSPDGPPSLMTSAAAQGCSRDVLPRLRVLDLSANGLTCRSATTIGRLVLWSADTLDELRLSQNPLGDDGFHTLAIYLGACTTDALRPQPFPKQQRPLSHQRDQRKEEFPQRGARTWAARLPRTLAQAFCRLEAQRAGGLLSHAAWSNAVAALHVGPRVLDVRACGASIRGVSTLLAGASAAHQLATITLSFNTPLTMNAAFADIVRVAEVKQRAQLAEEADLAASGTHAQRLPRPDMALWGHTDASATGLRHGKSGATEEKRRGAGPTATAAAAGAPHTVPLAEQSFLSRSPLILSGALLAYPPFSNFEELRAPCALRRVGLRALPLSQLCTPIGVRELLLNVFVCCDALELVDISDTFESGLVADDVLDTLLHSTTRRLTWDSALMGPAQLMGWQRFLEAEGELEFTMTNVTTAGQTRVGDLVMELFAHVSFNAHVRSALVPSAFRVMRELHLSACGLTDEAIRGLCIAVKGADQTGMLASLQVLDVGRNLLSVVGCDALLQAMVRDWPEPNSSLQAVSLQENVGIAAQDQRAWRRLNHTAEACLSRRLRETMTVLNASATTTATAAGAAGGESSVAQAECEKPEETSVSRPSRSMCVRPLLIQFGPVRGPVYECTCDVRGRAYTTFPESSVPDHPAEEDGEEAKSETAVVVADSAKAPAAGTPAGPDVSSIHGSSTAEVEAIPALPRPMRDGAPPPSHRRHERRPRWTSKSAVSKEGHPDDSTDTALGTLFAALDASRDGVRDTALAKQGGDEAEGGIGASPPTRPRLVARLQSRRSTDGASPSPHASEKTGTPSKPEEEWWLATPRGAARLVSPSPDSQDHTRDLGERATEREEGPTTPGSRSSSASHRHHHHSHDDDDEHSADAVRPVSSSPKLSTPPRFALVDQPEDAQPQPDPHVSSQNWLDAVSQLRPSLLPSADKDTSVKAPTPHSPPGSSAPDEVLNLDAQADTADTEARSAEPALSAHATQPSIVTSPLTTIFGAGAEEDQGRRSSLTPQKSTSRRKTRAPRTFALTYVHPEGHLLCRALHLLQCPAEEDTIGEEARTALEQDLLFALQPPPQSDGLVASTRELNGMNYQGDVSRASQEGTQASSPLTAADPSSANDATDWSAASPSVPPAAVEAVRCVSLYDPAQVTGAIRFDVTSSEKRAVVAQRMQRCLNVPLDVQRSHLPRLVACLDAWTARQTRLVQGLPQQQGRHAPSEDARLQRCSWDSVVRVEALARRSPYAKCILEAQFDKSATAAVHGNHAVADMHALLARLGDGKTASDSAASSTSYYTPPSRVSEHDDDGDSNNNRTHTDEVKADGQREANDNGDAVPEESSPDDQRQVHTTSAALVVSAEAPEAAEDPDEEEAEEANAGEAGHGEIFTISAPLQLGSASEEMAAWRNLVPVTNRYEDTPAESDEEEHGNLASRVRAALQSSQTNPDQSGTAANDDVGAAGETGAHVGDDDGDAEKEDNESYEEARDEDGLSVLRDPHELTGRLKSFVLSFSHLEGTIVCRAWELLHLPDAMGAAARRAMEQDLLFLLQPADISDREHGVTQVTVEVEVTGSGADMGTGMATTSRAAAMLGGGAGGAISNLLSLRVETNERRGEVSARLLALSRPSPTFRGSPLHPVGRDMTTASPSATQFTQKNWFPRLAAILESHPAMDSLHVIEHYLAGSPMRLTLRSNLVERYRSLGNFLHYHHGTMGDLVNELDAPSWDALWQRVDSAQAQPPHRATDEHEHEHSEDTDQLRNTAAADANRDDAPGRIRGELEPSPSLDSLPHPPARRSSSARESLTTTATTTPPPVEVPRAAAIAGRTPTPRFPSIPPLPPAAPSAAVSERERLLDNRVRRLLRMAYEALASGGSVALDETQRQRRVVCRGKWGLQRVALAVEWNIFFVLDFEKKNAFGSRKSAPMLIHPLMHGFQCLSAAEEGGESTVLIVRVDRKYGPEALGVSAVAMDQQLTANAHITIASKTKKKMKEAVQRRTKEEADALGLVPDTADSALATSASDLSFISRAGAKSVADVLMCPRVDVRVAMSDATRVQEAKAALLSAMARTMEAVEASIRSSQRNTPSSRA